MANKGSQELNLMTQTMEAKNILVSFLAVLVAVLVISSVSADDLASNARVDVDGTTVWNLGLDTDALSFQAGDSVEVEVWFNALQYDKDVVISAEINGQGDDVEVMSKPFDVEMDRTYKKTLTFVIPNELKDDLSDEFDLEITIEGDDHETEGVVIPFRIQRESYSADVKSVNTVQTIRAGQTFPVEVVLKNVGYNDLDDMYVTAKITTLGVQKSGYFGDVVALECDDEDDADSEYPWSEDTLDRNCDEDDSDTITGTLSLEMPYDVKAGKYMLEVVVENDDVTSTELVEIMVQNDFDQSVFKSGNSIWLVNPTENVVGYRIVAESPASVSESIVFVPAGASETVEVTANAEGDYDFDVNVFSLKGELVETVNFKGSAAGATETTQANPVVILTVVLAIIFIVLLIVLIVLIGKKPEKSGEFGESYY